MHAAKDRGAPRGGIVGRFALTGFLVFLLIGTGITIFRARDVRAREERAAASRAELIADEVIGPELLKSDLSGPMTGARYETILHQAAALLGTDPEIVRIKIWSTHGVVLFSNDPAQVGTSPGMSEELRAALAGSVANEISDLSLPENAGERSLADKLFETYVPFRLGATGPVVGAIEVYQNYSIIQAEIDRLTRTLSISLAAGLLVLYVVLLPVMVGATRTLRRQNQQLQEQASRFSELLEREQKRVAELRELDRLKSDFVAAASHELRSPLTSIHGYVHILRTIGAAPDETGQEALAAIDRQTVRLTRLITNLLQEARLEHGEVVTDVVTFAFGELAREVRADFHDSASQIRIEVEDDLPQVTCDRRRVLEVLTNLVDNAIKYSKPGAAVVIGCSVQEHTFTFWVSDQGVGISPEERARIFERFYQSDQSATRSVGGVGLGLHIVRGLVQAMGGTIEVDSVPFEGSTFRVSLPIEAESAAASLRADASTR